MSATHNLLTLDSITKRFVLLTSGQTMKIPPNSLAFRLLCRIIAGQTRLKQRLIVENHQVWTDFRRTMT